MIDRLRDPGREVPGCKFLYHFSLRPASTPYRCAFVLSLSLSLSRILTLHLFTLRFISLRFVFTVARAKQNMCVFLSALNPLALKLRKERKGMYLYAHIFLTIFIGYQVISIVVTLHRYTVKFISMSNLLNLNVFN